MKQIFTYLIFLAVATSLTAQITMDRDDFPLQTNFIDTFYRTSVNLPVDAPTLGADQNWDYSGVDLTDVTGFIVPYTEATNPAFPNALHSSERIGSFQGFEFSLFYYDGIDEDNYFEIGRTQMEAAYSISAITGGPNDTLRFVHEDVQYEGQLDYLDFPVEYEKEWTTVHKQYFPFELTVAAFGLNNTPGRQSREVTQMREIAGYGDLIIPDRNGNPSNPLPVLLIKVTATEVDSTFLGGQPAPEMLTSAFGLEQGATVVKESYVFYMPGYGKPVAGVRSSNQFNFSPDAADVMTGIDDVFTLEGKAFPNPIAAGQDLNFQLEMPFADGVCRLTDLTGKVVFETLVKAGGQHNFAVKMPTHLQTGLYMYQLETEDGERLRPRIISINQ